VQSKLNGWWRLMTLHHGLTLLLLASVLHTGHLHYYGCWVGTVEGTNPCLSALLTLRRIGRKDSDWCGGSQGCSACMLEPLAWPPPPMTWLQIAAS
jgi:hypothetical protein